MRPPLLWLTVVLALAITSLTRRVGAQPCPPGSAWCIGTDGRVILVPPAVPVDPNDARVRAEAEARARAAHDARLRAEAEAGARAEAEARARAELTLELARVERWRLYLGWQARVRDEAELTLSPSIEAVARANAAASFDRWAATPVPVLAPIADVSIAFPRTELGLLTFCAAVFTGRDLPSYKGACLPIRHRFDDAWALHADTSLLFERYGDRDYHSLGFHPAVAFSFARGKGASSGSHAFVRAGVDLHALLSGGAATPDAYVGGHVGLGVHADAGRGIGLGLEIRGLARGGTSASADGMSTLRLGAEIRLNVLSIAW